MSKYILQLFLIILTAVAFTSCGDDKDEPEATYKANGRGVEVYWDGNTEDTYFYLSADKVIMVSNQEEDWELRPYPDSRIKTLNTTNLYKDIKQALLYNYDIYVDEPLNIVVNDNTDWSKYPYSEMKGLVDEMKVLQSKYKYYTFDGESSFYAFDRIEGRPIFQY